MGLGGGLRGMGPDPAFVDRLDRHRVEVIEALAALAHRHHQPRLLKPAQVQHHRGAVELREAGGDLLGGQRAQLQLVADPPPHRVGESLENGIEFAVG